MREVAWGAMINTAWENLQITKDKISKAFVPPTRLICAVRSADSVNKLGEPHAQSLFLFLIVFGIYFFFWPSIKMVDENEDILVQKQEEQRQFPQRFARRLHQVGKRTKTISTTEASSGREKSLFLTWWSLRAKRCGNCLCSSCICTKI